MEGYKRCSMCKTFKEIDTFSRNKSTKDGLHQACKECLSIFYKNKERIICNKCGKCVYKRIFKRHLESNYHKQTIIPWSNYSGLFLESKS